MRKKLIGVFLILLAALILLQGYFVKWDISIWTLAWVTLLAVLSLSSFIKLLSQRFDSTIITAVENKTRAFQ